jgi:hypothetical protein
MYLRGGDGQHCITMYLRGGDGQHCIMMYLRGREPLQSATILQNEVWQNRLHYIHKVAFFNLD